MIAWLLTGFTNATDSNIETTPIQIFLTLSPHLYDMDLFKIVTDYISLNQPYKLLSDDNKRRIINLYPQFHASLFNGKSIFLNATNIRDSHI